MTISRRLCLVADIADWSGRAVPQQIIAQRVMNTVFRRAHVESGALTSIMPHSGDGLVVVFPPDIEEPRAISSFLRTLRDELRQQNRQLSDATRVRLRIALTSGSVETPTAGAGGR